MKEIIIIGAGDLGKEVVWLIEDINRHYPTYLIRGFLDNDEAKAGKEFFGYKVLGDTSKLGCMGDKNFSAVIAIQNCGDRKRIVEGCKDFNAWESIIHPNAVIASSSVVGRGAVVFPNVTVSVDTTIGDFGLLYIHSTVCNDCQVGRFVSVMSGAQISERVQVGECSYVAAGAVVYPNVVIGSQVMVGVGAAVSKNIADHATVVGGSSRTAFFK